MTPAAHVAVGAVRVYQWTVRPLIGANCRFFPSCSDYAIDAFRVHGAVRGGGLAARRILRCNPWNAGGYDPVPPCGCTSSASGGDGRVKPGHDDDPQSFLPGLTDLSSPGPAVLSWPGHDDYYNRDDGQLRHSVGQDDCRAGA
jgi:putative membrane protein insertion efficiency factor